MSRIPSNLRAARASNGHVIIAALALVLGLLLFVAAVASMVTQQLKQTKDERDYERALQLAEAGANAYLNMLANGSAASSVTNYGLIPPTLTYSNILSINDFKTEIKNASSTIIPRSSIIYYPAGQTKQCYVAYQTSGISSGGVVTVVAYGWSNGIVRRVQVQGQSKSVFDWAAIYGLDYNTGEYAWKFSGSASVVGAAGGEGNFVGNSNVTFYDGPVVWGNSSYASPYSNPDPTILASSANVPPGHVGAPGLANPLYRHYVRKLKVETADEAANAVSGTTQGADYFRTHNDNATGIRLLVKNTSTNLYRELSTPYSIPTTGSKAYVLNWPKPSDYTSAGMTGSETAIGLRLYPGNYYFQQISQQTSDVVYYRTFNDADSTNNGITKVITVSNNPSNPNSGQSANRTIHIWVGHVTSGSDPSNSVSVSYQNYMEYTGFASRLRIYVASSGGVGISGTNSNPPPPFRVNLLVYNNKDKNGNAVAPYGDVTFTSSTYLYGSLIGWHITVGGSTTIEKEAPEIGPDDRLTFGVTSWKELQ